MSMLEIAIGIAVRAHAGQLDKEGQPYITHPMRVMASLVGEAAQCVGILHDVVEDTAITLDDLRAAGLSEAIVEAVSLVTHEKSEPYADYVVRCKPHAIARPVKLADLQDNTRLDRSLIRPDRIQADFARIHRYVLSYKFLTDGITEEQYRMLMKMYG